MSLRDAHARKHMLQSQILTGHVLDGRVLEALLSVERADFVPQALRGSAYVDEEIMIGKGRFLLEPLVFARLLKYADIQSDENVMAIGAGTGYSAAVLSHLALSVVAVEEDPDLLAQARRNLARRSNIRLVQAPLTEGSPKDAPFDVILIEGAIERLPDAIASQLREGGRLLTALHNDTAKAGAAGLGKLVEYKKVRGQLYPMMLHDANVPLLAGFAAPSQFSL